MCAYIKKGDQKYFMDKKEAKAEYYKLKASSYMYDFYPELTGIWSKDKRLWFAMFDKLRRARRIQELRG